jgi:hypothetical protein
LSRNPSVPEIVRGFISLPSTSWSCAIKSIYIPSSLYGAYMAHSLWSQYESLFVSV